MALHVAFLRGINVSNRRASRSELCACFEEMGFREVATYRASGNVIFDGDREPAAEMAGRIEAGLAASLGYDVAVFLRSAADVRRIAGAEPFPAAVMEASKGKPQVAFLRSRPGARARAEVRAMATDQDRLALDGRELYWLPSGGIMDSPLSMAAIEQLAPPMTMRTKSTVEGIAARFLAGS